MGARDKFTTQRYSQGIGNSAAYMVSGYPYLTGSTNHLNNQEMEIKFPYVTKSLPTKKGEWLSVEKLL